MLFIFSAKQIFFCKEWDICWSSLDSNIRCAAMKLPRVFLKSKIALISFCLVLPTRKDDLCCHVFCQGYKYRLTFWPIYEHLTLNEQIIFCLWQVLLFLFPCLDVNNVNRWKLPIPLFYSKPHLLIYKYQGIAIYSIHNITNL